MNELVSYSHEKTWMLNMIVASTDHDSTDKFITRGDEWINDKWTIFCYAAEDNVNERQNQKNLSAAE